MFTKPFKLKLPTPEQALPGRAQKMPVPSAHFVNGAPLDLSADARLQEAIFGLGCFWGAEQMFWQTPGVVSTSVGYAGGVTPNPTYEEVCSRRARVTPKWCASSTIRRRSATTICCACSGKATIRRRGCARAATSARSTARRSTTPSDEQRDAAEASRDAYQRRAERARATATSRPRSHPRRRSISPRNITSSTWRRIRNGYCGHGGTGVTCPVGVSRSVKAGLRRVTGRPEGRPFARNSSGSSPSHLLGGGALRRFSPNRRIA